MTQKQTKEVVLAVARPSDVVPGERVLLFRTKDGVREELGAVEVLSQKTGKRGGTVITTRPQEDGTLTFRFQAFQVGCRDAVRAPAFYNTRIGSLFVNGVKTSLEITPTVRRLIQLACQMPKNVKY